MSDTDNWLEIGGPDSTIESGHKLPMDNERGRTMAKRLDGSGRIWACDGEYIYFRRKAAHEGTLERHAKFLAAGHYKHLGTYDDVEIYELLPGSPFKRGAPLNLFDMDIASVRRAAIAAACNFDWNLYVDALEELAGRFKGRYHEAYASELFKDTLTHIEHMIALRGGPGRVIRDREVINVRRRRGAGRGRQILLPA